MSVLALTLSLLLLQQPPTYRVDAQFVKVPVTVLDTEGKALLGLEKSDFRLFDEGESRPIENFVLDKSPVHVLFLLDASRSVQDEIQEIRWATLRFAQTFDRDDRIAVIGFSDTIEVLQDWTDDLDDVRKSLKKLKPGYRTALYDALSATTKERLQKLPGKKVIILLTDGLDNESNTSFREVMNQLIATNTVLYIVSRTKLIRDQVAEDDRVEFLNRVMKNVLKEEGSFVDAYFKVKETSMKQLAGANGGRVFFPDKLPALGQSYLQIARELKSQYVLTFRAPENAEKKFRRIRVECLRDVGQVYYREIYLAP